MLTVTYFPQQWGKENDDTLFASTPRYAEEFAALRQEVEQVLGIERARKLLYVNVGYNSVNHSPGPQTVHVVNALWTADMLCTMAETGTDIACYWAIHNAFPPRGGDYGYLSSEGSNTPRPVYWVFRTLSRAFSGNIVRCHTDDPKIAAHAARNGKALCLVLINEDSSASRKATVRLASFTPQSTARCWVLDERRTQDEQQRIPVAPTFTVALAPYSMTTLLMASEDSVYPSENLARRAHASASSFSTIGPAFGASSAIDGNPATRWCSAAWTKSDGDETQWFELSWDSSIACSRVVLWWGETYATTYRLEASQDGASWSLLKENNAGRGGEEQLAFPSVTLRALRVFGTRGTKGISAYSLREMEVYSR
jgi:hypothetical protein